MAETRSSVRDVLKTRSARLGREVQQTAITSLESFDVETQEKTPERVREAHNQRFADSSQKLQVAKVQIDQMREDLRGLCIGLEERLNEIGYRVSEAYQFQGWEKFWSFVGFADKAADMRYQRLQKQEVDELVEEVKKLTQGTINELGQREEEFEEAKGEYRATHKRTIQKYEQAQPKYKAAQAAREKLDAEIKERELELESGVISEDVRPQKEDELEELKRERFAKHLEELDFLGVVTNAQRAIPVIEQNIDAAEKSVLAIHQMRRDALEKIQNFTTLLDNAMVSIRNRATLERYESTDPAFNKTVTLITETNIKMAGAAMQVAKQRLAKAAIDPEKASQLMDELLGHINEFLEGVSDLEEEAKEGRHRTPPKRTEEL